MLSSLFSGISGLMANSYAISVIGNNIANVNTIGFKGSRTTFSDVLYQSIFGTAGTSQVGRGTALTSVDTQFAQGSFESTSEPTDLAIGGKGFFIVRSPEAQKDFYTRAGQFRFDQEGFLTTPAGYTLQGRAIDRTTNAPFGVSTDINISPEPSEPRATQLIGMAVNLQSDADWKGTIGDVTGTSELSTVATSDGKYPRAGSYTGTVTNRVIATDPITHAGTDAASSGTAFSGSVTINDYEIEMPTSGATYATAESLSSYLNIQLLTASAGYASQVHASWTSVAGNQYLDLSATANGVDITFDDTGLSAGTTGWTDEDKASTDLYGSTMNLSVDWADPDGTVMSKSYSGAVSSHRGDLTNWGGSGLDLSFTDPTDFSLTNGGTTAFTIAGFEKDQESATLNPSTTSNYSSSVTVYDSLGQPHVVTSYFRKAWEETSGTLQTNVWEWYALVDGADSVNGLNTVADWGYLKFNNNGVLTYGGDANPVTFDFAGGASQAQPIDLVFGSGSGGGASTQYPLASTTNFQTQDGYPPGVLMNVTVNAEGVISGHYSNGQILNLYQITLANFNNPWGLSREGGNLFAETVESGVPYTNAAGSGALGRINPNSLEQSNVDLATEFVKMIITQRGFQANSRIITTTDEMLAELMNIKR